MFVVTEGDAGAIRAAFDQEGELSAAVELRPSVQRYLANAFGDHLAEVGAARRTEILGHGELPALEPTSKITPLAV